MKMKQKQNETKVYICPNCGKRFTVDALIDSKLPPHQIEDSIVPKNCPDSGQLPIEKWE